MRDGAMSYAYSLRTLIVDDKIDPKPADVGFVVERVALGYVLLKELCFYPLRDKIIASTRCDTPDVPSYPMP